MLIMTNYRSSIAKAFVDLGGEDRIQGCKNVTECPTMDAERYLICDGFLAGKTIAEISDLDAAATWRENFMQIVVFCDKLFEANDNARVCIIGSESAFAGSHDETYANAKRAIHNYVERKPLRTPGQQLIGIAPTIIEDSGMTQRRDDLEACLARGAARRRGAWLQAKDVARLAYFALYMDRGNLCNTILRMNGGNW